MGSEESHVARKFFQEPLISKDFLDHSNNFFSQYVRTIMVTKYRFLLHDFPPNGFVFRFKILPRRHDKLEKGVI